MTLLTAWLACKTVQPRPGIFKRGKQAFACLCLTTWLLEPRKCFVRLTISLLHNLPLRVMGPRGVKITGKIQNSAHADLLGSEHTWASQKPRACWSTHRANFQASCKVTLDVWYMYSECPAVTKSYLKKEKIWSPPAACINCFFRPYKILARTKHRTSFIILQVRTAKGSRLFLSRKWQHSRIGRNQMNHFLLLVLDK